MSDEMPSDEPRKASRSWWGWGSGAGLAIGLGAGVAIGAALDNVGLWLSIGLVLGLLAPAVAKKKPKAK